MQHMCVYTFKTGCDICVPLESNACAHFIQCHHFEDTWWIKLNDWYCSVHDYYYYVSAPQSAIFARSASKQCVFRLLYKINCIPLNSGQIFMKFGSLYVRNRTWYWLLCFIEDIAGNNKYICQNLQFSSIYFVYWFLKNVHEHWGKSNTLQYKPKAKALKCFDFLFLSASEAEK